MGIFYLIRVLINLIGLILVEKKIFLNQIHLKDLIDYLKLIR